MRFLPLVRLVVAVAVVASAIAVFFVARDRPNDDELLMNTTTTRSVTTSTSDWSAALVKVDFNQGVLFLPEMLASDLEPCVEGARRGTTDRFCSSEIDDRWLQVSLRQNHELRLSEGEAIPDSGGAVWLHVGDDRRELAAPISAWYSVVLLGKNMTEQELVSIAESIPGIAYPSDLAATNEERLDLDATAEGDLAQLLGTGARATIQSGQASISSPDVSVLIVDGSLNRLADFAFTIDRPRLVGGMGRPIVVGESGSGTRSQVAWEQRGWLWSLETNAGPDDALEAALGLIERVAVLNS